MCLLASTWLALNDHWLCEMGSEELYNATQCWSPGWQQLVGALSPVSSPLGTVGIVALSGISGGTMAVCFCKIA